MFILQYRNKSCVYIDRKWILARLTKDAYIGEFKCSFDEHWELYQNEARAMDMLT